MNWFKNSQFKKMEEFFTKRTKDHINLVQDYCKKIEENFPEKFKGLTKQCKNHDSSKFEEPEKTPYIYITWQYKCKDEGKDFEIPKEIQEKMNNATEHHIKTNRHHPEYFTEEENLINNNDRDDIPDKIIDATKMNDMDLAEMVADWCAVSKERKNTPQEWAKKNINKRWKFTKDQEKLIYDLCDSIF